MQKHFFLTLVAATAMSTAAFAADGPAVGVVNFGNCVTDSKLGKQEQASFEALKKQLSSLLEDTEKQLSEISTKLNDSEFMDGLSPEGEEELKNKFQNLNEELNRYQSQYYQVLNQANMRIIQMLSSSISTAAEKVAKDKRLTMVINKEACFFYSPQLEITSQVVGEMDRVYDQDTKKQAQAPAVQGAPATAPAVKAEAKTAQAEAPAPAQAPAAAPKVETKTAQAPAATAPAVKAEAKTAQAPAQAPKAETKTAQAPAATKGEAKAETKTK